MGRDLLRLHGAGVHAKADTPLSSRNARFLIHATTLHREPCGQRPTSPDYPRRSRTAGNNFRSRPATRDDAIADAPVDGVVDDLRQRVHEPGDRCRVRGRGDRSESTALVASYRKTLFRYGTEKEG